MQPDMTANRTDSAKPERMYLTIPQAALFVGVSADTVRRRIKSGELPASMFAGKYRIHRDDLARLLRPVA